MLKQGLTLSGTLTSPKAITVSSADVSWLQSAVPIDFCSWSWQSSARASAPHAFTLSAKAAHRQTKKETREQSDEPSVTCRLSTYAREDTFPAVNSHDVIARARGNCTLAVLSYVMFLSSISPETTRPSGDRVINRTALTLMTLMMYGDWLKEKVIFLDVSLYVDTAVM